jgi:hypothetical protein
MNVKRHLYRFRIPELGQPALLQVQLVERHAGPDHRHRRRLQEHRQTVTSWQQGVTERNDILIDFSNVPVGTQIVLQNTAPVPQPIGPLPDPNTDGTVMRFTVVQSPSCRPRRSRPTLGSHVPVLTPDRPTRRLIQNVETDDAGRVLQAELDGQLFHELTTELPTVGATEDWDFINLTPLDHNKHVHLIQFQLIDRTPFDSGGLPGGLDRRERQPAVRSSDAEAGPRAPSSPDRRWDRGPRTTDGRTRSSRRSTTVTRIRIRWAIQSPTPANVPVGTNTFPINPVFGIGYVWHCHLVEHEDNEMMRPMTVIPIWQAGVAYPVGFRGSPGVNRGLVDFNGVDYEARVAHTSVAGQTPNTRPDLWDRINNMNGDWAVQIRYAVGDRVFRNGQVFRALQAHQATAANGPPNAAFWELVL